MGVGALFGSLIVAHRSHATRRLLFVAGLVFGVRDRSRSLAPTLGCSCSPSSFVWARGRSRSWAPINSMVQLGSDPQMRGRVMAVYTITMLGTTPIGGPFIGLDQQQFSPRFGMAVGGIATCRHRSSSPHPARVHLRFPRRPGRGCAGYPGSR